MQCNDINYCKCADRCFMLLFLPFSCSRVFIISNAIRLGKKKYQGVLAKIKFPTYVNFFTSIYSAKRRKCVMRSIFMTWSPNSQTLTLQFRPSSICHSCHSMLRIYRSF